MLRPSAILSAGAATALVVAGASAGAASADDFFGTGGGYDDFVATYDDSPGVTPYDGSGDGPVHIAFPDSYWTDGSTTDTTTTTTVSGPDGPVTVEVDSGTDDTTGDTTTGTGDGPSSTNDTNGDGEGGPGGQPTPPPPPPPPVDAGVVVDQVTDATTWPAPGIGFDPDHPGKPPLVHLPTWYHVTSGWTSHRHTLSIGGATITIRWEPTSTVWQPGDGTSVRCDGPGRDWQPGDDVDEPPCGHTYTTPSNPDNDSDTYTLTARVTYATSWTCTGNCQATSGTSDRSTSAIGSRPILVSTRHVLTTTS